MIEIKEVQSKQLDSYQKLLKEGLVHNEANFRISPSDIATEGFPTNDQPDSFTIGAFEGEKLVGIVSFMRDGATREKLKHKGILCRLLVKTNYRGQGIGKQLVLEVVNRAKLLDGLEQINLTVIPTNKNAKRMYEKLGFQTFSSEKRAIKWQGNYYREDQMVLFLTN